MIILWLLLIFAVLAFFVSLIYLILGLIFSKFKRTNRFGVHLIAMSMLVPGKCIACRCRQNCETAKCRNWNCENFYHCRQSKK